MSPVDSTFSVVVFVALSGVVSTFCSTVVLVSPPGVVTVDSDFFSIAACGWQPMAAMPTTQTAAQWNECFTVGSPNKEQISLDGGKCRHQERSDDDENIPDEVSFFNDPCSMAQFRCREAGREYASGARWCLGDPGRPTRVLIVTAVFRLLISLSSKGRRKLATAEQVDPESRSRRRASATVEALEHSNPSRSSWCRADLPPLAWAPATRSPIIPRSSRPGFVRCRRRQTPQPARIRRPYPFLARMHAANQEHQVYCLHPDVSLDIGECCGCVPGTTTSCWKS